MVHAERSQGYVWDVDTLTWIPATPGSGGGGGGDASAANQVTEISRLTSINTKTPALGQTNMAGSSPVTIASDQSKVPAILTDSTNTEIGTSANPLITVLNEAVALAGSEIFFLSAVTANTTGGTQGVYPGSITFVVDNAGGSGGTTISWEGTSNGAFSADFYPLTAMQIGVTPPNFATSTILSGKTYWTINTAGVDSMRCKVTNYSAGSVTVLGFCATAVNPAFTTVYTQKVTPTSGSASSSGNNTLITPTSGKKLRIFYLAYNPSAANEVAFRFGAAGGLFLRNSLTVGGSVIAKDFGDLRYIEGAVDETLVLNLSSGSTTIWNAIYTEI